MTKNTEGHDDETNRETGSRSEFGRRDYLKLSGASVGASMLAIEHGVSRGAASPYDFTEINVVEAGVDSTGQTDVSQDIRDLIDDRVRLYFPEGTYLMESPLTRGATMNLEAFELVGEAGTTILVDNPDMDVAFRCGPLYQNTSLEPTDTPYHVVVDTFTFDFTQEGVGGQAVGGTARDTFDVYNITVEGQVPHSKPGIGVVTPNLHNENGSGTVSNVVARDGCTFNGINTDESRRTHPIGISIIGKNKGEITVKNCDMRYWVNNGAYLKDSHGPVYVENCFFKNNGNGNLRIWNDMTATDITVVMNNDGHGSEVPSTGLWHQSGTPTTENVKVIATGDNDADAIRINGGTVRNADVLADVRSDYDPGGIYDNASIRDQSDGDYPITIENLDVRGAVDDDGYTISILDKAATLRNVCIHQPNRNGIHLERGSIEDTNVTAANTAYDLGSGVSTTNTSEGEYCPMDGQFVDGDYRLTIVPKGEAVTYTFDATGDVHAVERGYHDSSFTDSSEADSKTVNSDGTVTVEGATGPQSGDKWNIEGGITAFDIDGDADIFRNGTAVAPSEVPSDDVGRIIDDFERDELAEYSFDDEATLSKTAALNGEHGLDLDGSGESNTSGSVRSDSGLGTYPGPDDIWEFWWNPQTANQNFNVNFALQSGDLTEGFRVNISLDDSNQLISFQERGSSGDTYIGQSDLDIQTGTWYRTIVDGSGSDGWSVHVDTGAGSSVVGEFTTDATQYTHYERSGIAYWISGADRVYLDDIAVRDGNPLRDEEPPGTVVDDFKSGDLDDYSVTGTDGAGVSDDARFRGSYGLELNGATGGSGTVRSDTGLNAYPGQNDRWEFWWNPQTENEFFRVTFAIQSDDRSRAFNLITSLDSSNQFVQLEERGPNGDEYLGHTDLDLSTDTWYRTVVDGTDSDAWAISVDTGEGTTTIGEFTSDPTRYTWYDRSGIAYWISGSDHVYLDDVTIRVRGADADGVPGTVVDDFESGKLGDYDVPDTTEAAASDAASFRGDYSLELDGPSGTSGWVRSDTGLNAYPGQNDRWEFWWNTRTESEHVSVYFAIQSDDLSETFRLSIGLDSSDQFVELEERGTNGDNYLGHADLDLSTDTWYRTVVDGTDGDRWTVSVDTGEGTPTVGEFTSDPTRYTWYDRSGIAYWISGSDRVFVDDVTIRTMGEASDDEPTLVVDDFDDGDLEEWTIPSQTGTVETVTGSYDGSAALRCYDDGFTRGFANGEGSPSLENVPRPGDKWEFYIKIDTADIARFYFGRQGPEDDAGQYEIQFNRASDGTDGFRIEIDDGSSTTTVGTGAYGDIYETGTWYRVRHWWDRSEKESSHVCELYDVSAESVVTTVSGSNETWESGGIGVWANGNTDVTIDQIRILDRDP